MKGGGFSFYKFLAAILFLVVCTLLVFEPNNFTQMAKLASKGMADKSEEYPVNISPNLFKLDKAQYKTPLGKVYKREYKGYTLFISCEHRGPLYGYMTLGKDQGNLRRDQRFSVDQKIPKECNQISHSAYKHWNTYHRGHLFAANHFDHDLDQMWESFFMSNVVPQHRVSNTGAWLQTEILTECYREYHDVYLAAGVIYGEDKSDDYFIQSHRVTTPTAMWKYIQLDDDMYAAWIIPNSSDATKEHLSFFRVPINELKQITGIQITPTPHRVKQVNLSVFPNCHRT